MPVLSEITLIAILFIISEIPKAQKKQSSTTESFPSFAF